MVDADNNVSELTITRFFKAPVELIWQAWTDPVMVKHWWGPKDFTAPFSKIDLRVGGKYLSDMRSPDGKDFWSTGVFCEVEPLKRLVMTDSFADENGNVVPATHYDMGSDFPQELLIKVIFQEEEGQTKVTLNHSSNEKIDAEMLNDMEQGWNESFDKLNEYLKQKFGMVG